MSARASQIQRRRNAGRRGQRRGVGDEVRVVLSGYLRRRETRLAVRRPVRRAILRDPNICFPQVRVMLPGIGDDWPAP
jgi:hypothetical protein